MTSIVVLPAKDIVMSQRHMFRYSCLLVFLSYLFDVDEFTSGSVVLYAGFRYQKQNLPIGWLQTCVNYTCRISVKIELLLQSVNYNYMMMMMKLPILPCAEKLELVLSTAPKT